MPVSLTSIVPPLADAHLHLEALGQWGFAEGLRSQAQLLERLEAWQKEAQPHAALHAQGVPLSYWPDDSVAFSQLTAGHAVVLSSPDGHGHQLNETAWSLTQAELLKPGACQLWDLSRLRVREVPAGFWQRHLGQGQLEGALQRGLARVKAEGLCEVHDMATSLKALEWLAQHPLGVRVVSYLEDSEEGLAWLAAHPQGPHHLSSEVYVAGLKLFFDGAVSSGGAAFEAPYCQCHGRGYVADLAQLQVKAEAALAHGYGLAVHAIGDRACRQAVTLFAHLRQRFGPTPILRLEHAQHLSAETLEQAVSLGVVFSMQPHHLEEDRAVVLNQLGPERMEWAYPWAKVLAAGGHLAFGSDAPYGALSPGLGFRAATTSAPLAHEASRHLSTEQALKAYREGVFGAAPEAFRALRAG